MDLDKWRFDACWRWHFRFQRLSAQTGDGALTDEGAPGMGGHGFDRGQQRLQYKKIVARDGDIKSLRLGGISQHRVFVLPWTGLILEQFSVLRHYFVRLNKTKLRSWIGHLTLYVRVYIV